MTVERVTITRTVTPFARLRGMADPGWLTLGRLRLAVDGFALLVTVTVAFALAALVWRLTGYDDGRDRVAIATGAGPAAAVDVSPILRLSPFGAPAMAAAAGGGGTVDGLTLRGIVMALGTGSTALIAAGDGVSVSYGVGQTVGGGAVIESIERDRVTLRVASGTAVLTFPQTIGASTTAPGFATPAAPVAPVQIVPPPPPPPPPAPVAATPGASLLGGLSVTRDADGLRVGANVPPNALAAGLQPGDVIVTVAGQAPDTAMTDPAVMSQAAQSGRVQAEVIRDGRRQSLSFPIR